MKSIFFDLETSDRDFIGQILNYSFIVVDEKFTTLDECSGTVSLTPLQVPSLGALLANRILILEHRGERSEREAALHIDAFLKRNTDSEKIALVGFNSFKFDVPFLRTVLIRNGLNPYYSGNFVYRDLYPAVQYLACTDQSFKTPKKETGEYSLSLEAVTKRLGLLTGVQSHESRADVLLEIALAQYLFEKHKLHIVDWDPYLARFAHTASRGELFYQLSPDRESGGAKRTPVLLFDVDKRNSLWLDLNRYQEKKPAWTLGKISGGHLFIVPYETENTLEKPCLEPVIRAALEEHKAMTLARYFDRKSECDIEQDIYRIDFVSIERLHQALYFGDEKGVREAKIRDLSALLVRAKLAVGDANTPQFLSTLHKYGQYRYGGGQMLLSRYRCGDATDRFATSKDELLKEVAGPRENLSDDAIRQQLSEFYASASVLQF